MMHGLILAAGFGSRLGHDIPKCLIPWGRHAILDHQLERLEQAGIEDVWVVVGFQAPKVRRHAAKRWPKVRFVDNPQYMDTQNGKSMLLGLRAVPRGGVVCINGDVVFDDGILQSITDRPAFSSFAAVPKVCGEEEMKYHMVDGRLVAVSKQVHGEGELIGLNYVAAGDRKLLEQALDYNDVGQYYERSFDQMLPFTHRPVRCVPVGKRRAMEIDFPEDLEAARKLFAP